MQYYYYQTTCNNNNNNVINHQLWEEEVEPSWTALWPPPASEAELLWPSWLPPEEDTTGGRWVARWTSLLTRASRALRESGRVWLCWTVSRSPARPLAASAGLSVTRWVVCLRRPLGEAGNGAAAARVAPRDDLRVGPPLDGRPRPLFLLGGIVVFGRGQHRWRLEPENLSQKILVAT